MHDNVMPRDPKKATPAKGCSVRHTGKMQLRLPAMRQGQGQVRCVTGNGRVKLNGEFIQNGDDGAS